MTASPAGTVGGMTTEAMTAMLDEAEDGIRSAVADLVAGIDEMLAATAGHQVVAASGMADMLLDLRSRATAIARVLAA